MHHTTLTGNFVPMSVKRRKTSKSAWTNAATSLPLRFHACDRVLGSQCSTTKPCREPRQEIRKIQFRNFTKSRMSIAIERGSSIPTSRMKQHHQWEDGAGLSLFYHETNNKHFSKMNLKIANRTLEKILLQALHHKSTLQPG